MIRRAAFLILFVLLLSASVWAQVATSVRIQKAKPDDLRGNVVIIVKGKDRTVAKDAWNAWLIRGGKSVVYSKSGGAGGFENEGQSLWRYDLATGRQQKLMSEFFMISKVVEALSRTNKPALLVTMRDGGLGAYHVTVVHPQRGQVWRRQMARFVSVRNGRVGVALYRPEDFQDNTVARPRQIMYLSLDRLLVRQASSLWPVGVPRR